jgi:transposase
MLSRIPTMHSMYIRIVTQKNKVTGQAYITHSLVEAYRNAEGKVRQHTLMNLGTQFDIPKEYWKVLADRIEEIRRGQVSLFELDPILEKEAQRIAKLIIHKFSENVSANKKATQKHSDYQTVDLNSIHHQHVRKIGAEHVGLHAVMQLKLDKILSDFGFNQKQIHLAIGNIVGRLVNPGSELKTHRYLSEQSALDELLGTDFSNLSLKNFYMIADLLFKNKLKIEKALYHREKDLFNFEETITLYDITNTYFEGRSLANPKARYGRSKEKRNDCVLVSLGMVLDSSGFPKKSEIFPGNVSEPKTLQQMLELLGNNNKATIVMDAGIATKENIEWLKSQNRKYIVVSRKRNLEMPENQERIIVKEDKHNLVQVSLVKNEETKELELYCHSKAKEAKTKQMRNKFYARFEDGLTKLQEGLTKKGCTKIHEKILQRIGRLKEKYNKVGKFYQITATADSQNKNTIEITWTKKEDSSINKVAGMYRLRSNRLDLDEASFWNIYTTLTELEDAFCSLKSELGFRPVYHQKEHRIDAHLFISIIAYHLLHTIRYQLKSKGICASWETLRDMLDTQCRITTTLSLKDGRNVQIRKTTTPDTNQLKIYKALNIDTHPGKTEKAYF